MDAAWAAVAISSVGSIATVGVVLWGDAKGRGRAEEIQREHGEKLKQHDAEFSTTKRDISGLTSRVSAVEARCDERTRACS